MAPTPTTAAATEAVGDWETYVAEAYDVVVNNRIAVYSTLEDGQIVIPPEAYTQIPEEGLAVPLPDVTNPDAAAALKSIYEFEWWTFTHRPSGEWADIYALEGTAAHRSSRDAGDGLAPFGAVREYRGQPYTFHTSRVVDPDDPAVPDEAREALAELPAGSVIVEFEGSIGPFVEITPEDSPTVEVSPEIAGRVWHESDGWERKPRYVILTPTPTGWRVSWEGPV